MHTWVLQIDCIMVACKQYYTAIIFFHDLFVQLCFGEQTVTILPATAGAWIGWCWTLCLAAKKLLIVLEILLYIEDWTIFSQFWSK